MRRLLLAVAVLPLLGSPLMAQSPNAPLVAAADPMKAPLDIAAMTSYERQMLQDALIWTSDYVGLKDGAWGRMSDAALRNWLKKNNSSDLTILTNTDVGALLYAADRAKGEAGWKVWRDPATQSYIGYPSALVTPKQEADGKGTIYDGEQGFYMSTRVLPFTLDEMRKNLADLGVMDGNIPGYRLDKTDRQVITARRGSKTIYARFDRVGTLWRGFLVMADADNPRLNKLITAVSTEFGASGHTNFDEVAIASTEPGFRSWLAMAGKSPKDALTGPQIAAVPINPSAQSSAPAPAKAPAAPPVATPAAVPVAPPRPQGKPSGSGTAFVVRRDGTMLTNEHVVNGCTRLALPTGEAVRVIATSAKRDLALLRAERTYEGALRFRRDQTIDHGETVRAFGYPYYQMVSTSLNITEGIVTALKGIGDDPTEFQVNAAIQPGNSGGPLVDENGLVIGVAVSTLSTNRFSQITGTNAQSMNYGIRGQIVESFLLENGVLVEKARGEGKQDLREIARAVTPLVSPVLCYGR